MVPLLLLLISACSDGDETQGLTVFAAASLRAVVDELEVAWLEEHPDLPLTVATEASNVLAAQIREGARADVFISADSARPWELSAAGLTAAEPVPFAHNRVALVAPVSDDTVRVAADLATPGVRIVGVSDGTPIARYALEALAQLAASRPEPREFAEAVAANVVSREDNVRAALAKVELGEGDAAFVYRTDALDAAGVREVPLPATVEVTAQYAAVQVSHEPAAGRFVAWLGEPTAAAIIAAAGFEVEP